MWRLLLQYHDAADASPHKAPLGGKKTRPNPTDGAEAGTKRHVLTDGGGVPIALVITAAKTPDKAALGHNAAQS